MKRFKLTGTLYYEVNAESEDDVFNQLEERFAIENIMAENEFWDNLEIKEIDELEELIEDKTNNLKLQKTKVGGGENSKLV